MSTTDEQTATTESTTAIMATLVRGRVYFFNNREFINGEPQVVTPADKEWLTKHAVDLVSVEDENEHQVRQKFSFSDGQVERSAPKRTRGR